MLLEKLTMQVTDILIIGAGISGLMAAQSLQARGRQVTLLEQAPMVGGRLATRAIGPGLADSGAQFFTVREPAFQSYVTAWQHAGLVYQWATGWNDGSLLATAPVNDGYPRYAVHGGMNALARALADHSMAQGVAIHTAQPVTTVKPSPAGWQVFTATGDHYQANTLVITIPVPQALALLQASGVDLAPADQAALARLVYAPCLCGLFWLEGEITLPAPGALQRPGADLSWVADNRQKGISPAATLITVHASPAYSTSHAATPDEELLATFQASLQPFMRGKVIRHEAILQRWREALPTVTHPDRYLRAQGLPPLYFGGDAFRGPRVEGSALSGLAIGTALANR
ncbi:MAG: FAD-dependent oxidoreductase [Caldilineaceae bacterium]|nr:FAD-dependent oxidoreductase [Caldilineaceae bacterium]